MIAKRPPEEGAAINPHDNNADRTSLSKERVPQLTMDFLTWIAREPRSYAEAMEAWRSNCPRLTVWEDALADDLIRVENAGLTAKEAVVILTLHGLELLSGA